MKLARSGKMQVGIKTLEPYWISSSTEFASIVIQANSDKKAVEQRLGKSAGYEFAEQEAVGDTLLRAVCIQKCELGPVQWEFIFYKASDR